MLRLFSLLSFAAASSLGVAGIAAADTELDVGSSIVLSDQDPDGDLAAKIKIVGLGNGVLVVVYADAGTTELVYDVKSRTERPARDVFVRRCNANTSDCSDLTSWSTPLNIAETASQSSAATSWRGPDEGRLPFYGDSDKPNIFSHGPAVVVTWTDKLCDASVQGSITYLELDQRALREPMGKIMADNRVVGFGTYGEQYNAMHINQTFTAVAIAEPAAAAE